MDADGYLRLTGRLKEIINRGGEKISPREIDEVLMDHPAIQQAVTFAMPHDDARRGRRRRDRAAGGSERRRAGAARPSVSERLAAFKVPRKIVFLDGNPEGRDGQAAADGAPTSYINVNSSYQAVVGQPIFVDLWTDVSAESNVAQGGGYPYSSANAYIDPYFSLPQSLIDEGYQIEVSAGVGNSPVGAPGPIPGAGLASIAFIALAGFVARARGLLAR